MSLIPFAYSINKKELVGINDVPSGMKCNCLCPSCGMKLIARKGDINEHHFAHKEEADELCEYSFWVSVRDMSKQIIQKSQYINIHAYNLQNLHKRIFTTKEGRVEIHQVKEFSGEEFDLQLQTSIGDLYIYFKTMESSSLERDRRHNSQRNLYFSKDLVLSINLANSFQEKNSQDVLKNILIDSTNYKKLLKPMEKFSEVFDTEEEEPLYQEEEKKQFYHQIHKHIQKRIDDLKRNQETPLRKLTFIKDTKILHLMNLQNEELRREDIRTFNTMKNFYQLYTKINQHDKCEIFKEIATGVNLTLISYKNSFYALALIKYGFHIYQVEDDEILYIGEVKSISNAKKEIDSYLDMINSLF